MFSRGLCRRDAERLYLYGLLFFCKHDRCIKMYGSRGKRSISDYDTVIKKLKEGKVS